MFETDEELIKKTPNSFLNHPASQENLLRMQEWIEIVLSTVYQSEIPDIGFSESELLNNEKSLGFTLPSILRLLYSYIGKEPDLLIPEVSKQMDLKILRPDELYIEKDVIIHDYYGGDEWYKTDVLVYSTNRRGNKSYLGIDYKRGWLLSFYKKWYWQKDHMAVYKDLPVTLTCIAISHMRNVFKTKVKGVTGWETYKLAEEKFSGYFERFSDFEHFDHTLFFNKQKGALGWFRAGSAIPDLLVGCNNKMFIEDIVDKLDFSKAKYIKVEE